MEKYGLKSSHAVYLATLSRYPEGVSSCKLCEISGRDKSDVSRMVSILESKGLVFRKNESANLYRAAICLTDEGKEAAEHVQHRAMIAVDMAGQGLTEDERETFYRALDIISENLRVLSKDGLPK